MLLKSQIWHSSQYLTTPDLHKRLQIKQAKPDPSPWWTINCVSVHTNHALVWNPTWKPLFTHDILPHNDLLRFMWSVIYSISVVLKASSVVIMNFSTLELQDKMTTFNTIAGQRRPCYDSTRSFVCSKPPEGIHQVDRIPVRGGQDEDAAEDSVLDFHLDSKPISPNINQLNAAGTCVYHLLQYSILGIFFHRAYLWIFFSESQNSDFSTKQH
jgi:hypothetical protein